MFKTISTLWLATVLFTGCDVLKAVIETNSLSEHEAANGLKEALQVGIANGADQAGQSGGYLDHATIRIPWPDHAIKIANTLRDVGLGNMVDDVERSINRAAENAAVKAKPIFMNAIKAMTFKDAMDILFGEEDAATMYLKEKTTSELTKAFQPDIAASLASVNATRFWETAIDAYNKIPFITKVDPDLEGYVTRKALEGLFFLVAEEERKIRKDPVARVTALLVKVFGYRDRNPKP